jgi:DNA-binding transcriptional LysR family regulator
MHQSSPTDLWQYLCLGVREARARVEGAGRRAVGVQQHGAETPCDRGGLRPIDLPKDQLQTHLADGRLIRVLEDWCAPFSGYHLYYPSRRQLTPAFALLVEALRYRARSKPVDP